MNINGFKLYYVLCCVFACNNGSRFCSHCLFCSSNGHSNNKQINGHPMNGFSSTLATSSSSQSLPISSVSSTGTSKLSIILRMQSNSIHITDFCFGFAINRTSVKAFIRVVPFIYLKCFHID